MNEDDAVRARVAGRTAVYHKTIWHVTIGEFQVRCLHERPTTDMFIIQARVDGSWTKDAIAVGKDPVELLQRVTSSVATGKIIRDRVDSRKLF